MHEMNYRCGRFDVMAQLVEHIVHIDGVTGSSPVATTTRLASLLVRFFLRRDTYEN